MSQPRPVYVLSPRGPDALPADLVPGARPLPLADPQEIRTRTPGVLLLPIERLSGDEVVAALRVAAEAPAQAPWLPILVEQTQNGPRALPVSLGWAAAPAELARWAGGDLEAEVFELRHVLSRVARGRHDINNPLTSALAETQLALMDAQDPNQRAGLEMIEEQLRRIRDMVASLRSLRAPF